MSFTQDNLFAGPISDGSSVQENSLYFYNSSVSFGGAEMISETLNL